MRRSQSKRKENPIKSKDEQEYAEFLQKKLQEEQYLMHLINVDTKSLAKQNNELRQTIQKLRSSEKQAKLNISQLQNQNLQYQQKITELQQRNHTLEQKIKLMQKQASKQVNATQPLETKLMFKQFLNNTFPTYKDTIKRILRFFMYIEKYEEKGKEERVKAYHSFIKSIVEKLMLFIFPKKTQQQTTHSIALSMVDRWRAGEEQGEKVLKGQIIELKDKEVAYIKQIESCEAELLRVKAAKCVLENKTLTYEKTLKVKAAEFVVHFKKALLNKAQYGEDDDVIGLMSEVLGIFQSVVSTPAPNAQPQTSKLLQTNLSNQLIALSNKSLPIAYPTNEQAEPTIKKTKKQAPLLKKNIYGYYVQPQLSTQWNFLTLTKHLELNKTTQTLPDDLTILIAHPVLLLHLFDANIRPQRTRHNTQFYVKVHKNSEYFITSQSIDSPDYKPVWDRQYLVKGYDFPSLKVELMNKSKGLKDKSIGEGKLTVESCESRIVNVKKEKEFQGRVRFGIHYPKGNIFEYVINSVQLIVPQGVKMLSQSVQIQAPMNEPITTKFTNANLITYLTNTSILIIQGYQGSIEANIINKKLSGCVGLQEFTQKQGSKTVTIQAQEWQVILEGYVVLVVSEESEPERIECPEEGKFVAVRAGYPLVSASYHDEVLYSHVKWPLVFEYVSECAILTCVLESEKVKGKTQQAIINPIIKPDTQFQVVKHDLLSTPPHIYTFFLQTLQGPEVHFSYQSDHFVKLPQKIKLQIHLNFPQMNSQNQKPDPFMQKGKRTLKQNQVQKIEWFVETKELMCNFYKVMTRTYKATGYSKFRIGYCKVRNLLTNEGKDVRKSIVAKDLVVDEPFEGEYYVKFTIFKAYLPALSSTAKYSVKVSTQTESAQTDFMHGQLINFNYQVLMKLTFPKDQATYLTISLSQQPLIGSQKLLYEARIPISVNIFKLGRLILNLGQINGQKSSPLLKDQNVLILDGFSIPDRVYSLWVTDIQVQVEQQADWFSKIDPYLTFYAHGRKVYQTKVIDNAGDNALWQNVNFKLVVAENPSTGNSIKSVYEMFKCRIFDQDLIKDDYLGECSVSYDEEVAGLGNELSCIRASISKEEKNCGELRLHGKFKRIEQSAHKVVSHAFSKLVAEKHQVYQVCLTEMSFTKAEFDFEEPIELYSVLPTSYKQIEQKIDPKNLSSINLSIWVVSGVHNEKQIEVNLIQKKKHFFKTQTIQLGSIRILNKLILAQSTICELLVPIVDSNGQQIGAGKFFVEPVFETPYCVIDAYTSAARLDLQSKIEQDSLTLQPITAQHVEPLMPSFNDMYLFSNSDCTLIPSEPVNFKEVSDPSLYSSTKRITYDVENTNYGLNSEVLTVFSIHKTESDALTALIYKRPFTMNEAEFTRMHPVDKSVHKLYTIKVLHWQPVKFEASKQINIRVNFSHKNGAELMIGNKLNEVFNSYYAFSSSDKWENKTMPMVFSGSMFPRSLTVGDNSNQGKHIVVDLSANSQGQYSNSFCLQKHIYVADQGALYYELEEYKLKYRRIFLRGFYVKISSPQLIDMLVQGMDSLSLGVSESEMVYGSGKRVGRSGWYFENVEFYVPVQNATNQVALVIRVNGRKIQVSIKGKLNKWQYIYTVHPDCKIHCSLLIESDISEGCISLQRKPPTLISFIQMQSIKLHPSKSLPDTQLTINFSLHNQHIQLKATQNSSQDNTYYQMSQPELLYIYEGKESVVKVEMVQEKIFGKKVVGWCNLLVKEEELALMENTIVGQVVNEKGITLGKVQFNYKAMPLVKYLYVDIDKIVPRQMYHSIVFELVPFGSKKSKIQRITMRQHLSTSPQSYQATNPLSYQPNHIPSTNSYDTSQDLIVCQQDYQDYNIHVSIQDSNQLLGKFKLCDLIKRQNDNDYEFVSAVHPLKIQKNQLNGLVGINYIQYVSHKQVLSSKAVYTGKVIKVLLKKWRFWNQKKQPSISLTLTTTNRKIFTDKIAIDFDNQSTAVEVILPENQKFTITLLKQRIPKALSVIDPKKFSSKNQQLIILNHFTQCNQVYGVCMMEIQPIRQEVSVYELEDVTANNLEDMELFVKMNPYLVVDSLNQEKMLTRAYKRWRTDISEGKNNLFWKIGLLFDNDIKLTFFDKDFKFDDYIGEANLQLNLLNKKHTESNSDRLKIDLKLKSVQNNKQTGSLIANLRKANQPPVSSQESIFQPSLSETTHRIIDLRFISVNDFNSSILSKGDFVHSFSVSFVDVITGAAHSILRMENPFEHDDKFKVDVLKNLLNNGFQLDSYAFDIDSLSETSTKIVLQLYIATNQSPQRKDTVLKAYQQLIDPLKSQQSSYSLPIALQQQKKGQNQHVIQIFNSCQIRPLRPNHQQNKPFFLINKLAIWYDLACFMAKAKLTISIIDSLAKNKRQYSCFVQMSALDAKNGFSFIEFDILKYLKHSIWIQGHQKVEVSLLYSNQFLQISTFDFSNEPQFLNSQRFFIESSIIAQNISMKIGKLFIQMEKVLLASNLSLPQQQMQMKPQKDQKKNKSQLNWIQMKIKSAYFNENIEWFYKLDPYCEIQCISKEESTQKVIQKHRTATEDNKGKEPVWEETFFFCLFDNKQSTQFTFTLMDEEVAIDRQIGYAELEIKSNELEMGEKRELELKLVKSKEKKDDKGTLRLEYKLLRAFIVFRSLSDRLNSQQSIMISYQGKSELKEQVRLFKPYPLGESKQLKLIVGKQQITIDRQMIKANSQQKLIVGNQIELVYDVYE